MPKLKLGYIGVVCLAHLFASHTHGLSVGRQVNRSQRDITEHRTIVEARAKEEEFFADHPAYRSLIKQLGTKFLVDKCSQLLVSEALTPLVPHFNLDSR